MRDRRAAVACPDLAGLERVEPRVQRSLRSRADTNIGQRFSVLGVIDAAAGWLLSLSPRSNTAVLTRSEPRFITGAVALDFDGQALGGMMGTHRGALDPFALFGPIAPVWPPDPAGPPDKVTTELTIDGC